MDGEEFFTRLLYQGTVQLGFSMDEVWLMRFGLLLDLIACHRQYTGVEKPRRGYSLDDIIPM